jgi:hypothetical protein
MVGGGEKIKEKYNECKENYNYLSKKTRQAN